MDPTQRSEDQQARWNGQSGNAWVEAQHVVDEVLRPFEEILVDAARALSAQHVLDVGCGTGGTSIAVAAALESSQVVGVDISEPMITAARARAPHPAVTFLRADAQTHPFEPSFELIMSRFGVMFFQDPVRAFTNLRRAATGAGALRCIVWRSPEGNPFMTTAERAAAPLLPDLPARIPDAPGQFGLASKDRTAGILRDSGWTGVAIDPIDVECVMPEDVLTWYFSTLGPVGTLLSGVDETTRARVVDTVRPAFDPFVHGDQVRYTAACWMLSAHA
ncbi:class I SAM-dependent methyltransferase [Nocardia sp. NPDC052316]|uniref:class I SAM-dependent methyltransferase n=1 Tax=Nocardia sp. NPDC052316 TaxID=3364329 RepID=UPI0037C94F21